MSEFDHVDPNPYLQLYLGAEPAVRPVVFTVLVVWLVFLFSTLGISASDFFTPNLATIAQFLHLSEDVAGVTLLAFGNASPDVFATFAAIRANSGALAIGELLGAASFIVSCVAGSMCIVRPFKVDCFPFLRDVGFFTVAICILLFILRDGLITALESEILVLWYVCYALTVVVGGWCVSRREKRRRIEAIVRAEYTDDVPYTDDPSPSLPTRTRSLSIPRLRVQVPSHPRAPSPINTPLPSFSLVGALEFRQVVASLRSQVAFDVSDSPVSPYTHRQRSTESDDWDVPLNGRPPHVPTLEEPPTLVDVREDQPTIPSISLTPAALPIEEQIPPPQPNGLRHALSRTCYVLFPSLHHFSSKTLIGKIISLLAAPAVTALTVTLPVVITPRDDKIDEEDGVEAALMAERKVQNDLHEVSFNKWLTAVQAILGPLFAVATLFDGSSHMKWLLAGTALGGLVLASLVLAFSSAGTHPAAQMTRCSIGFLVSIVWIMAIADEVVKLLQTLGSIVGLSDAIIGLTVFALGNSLADLVANTSVAVFAPMMGFSACFGGPMVNILLGIGVSGTYVIHHAGGAPIALPLTATLLTSCVGLLAVLVTTLVVVPARGYVLSRRWGAFLMVAYVALMSANVAVEAGFDW